MLKGKKILTETELGNGFYKLGTDDGEFVAQIIPLGETSEEAEEEAEEETSEEGYTLKDLQEMDLADLKDICKDNDIKVGKKDNEDDLIEKICEALEIPTDDDENEADDDEESVTEYTKEDLEAMDIDELKELCEENEIKVTKKDDEESLVEKLCEALSIADEDEASDDDEDEVDDETTWEDLIDMDEEELRELAKDNDVKISKKASEDDIRKAIAEEFSIAIPKGKKK